MTDVQTPAEGDGELRENEKRPESQYAGSGLTVNIEGLSPDEGAIAEEVGRQLRAKTRKKPRHRAIPLMPEVRHWRAEGIEVRSASKTDEIILTGTPIVYSTPYTVTDMFGAFEERMAPGVAADVLARGADVRFLFNHDGLPLARSTSGTMTLTDGPDALRFEARLDARQQLANDLAIACERSDVNSMSVGFIVARDEWDEDMEKRTVLQFADLLDVSAVTYPASPSTAVQVAKRMALEVPIESRARLRNLIVAERAGKAISGANKEKVASAIEALHGLYEAGGGNLADLIDDDQDEADTRTDDDQPQGNGDATPASVDPGEKIRRLRAQTALRKRRS